MTTPMTAVLRVMLGEPDRLTYLGGSDAAAILGVGAYGKTPLSVYLKKIGADVEKIDAAKQRFFDRRKRWEGPISIMLREEFDAPIVAENVRYIDPEFDFMAAEIDFEWVDAAGVTQNGEIKTVSPFAFNEQSGWGDEGTDEIPVHYAAQVMWGLMVTGRARCVVAALAGLDRIAFYTVERDEETIATMRRLAVTFWLDNVQKQMPPEPICLDDVLRLTINRAGKPVELDAETAGLLRDVAAIRDRKKAMDDEVEDINFKLLNFVRRQWGAQSDEDDPTDNADLLVNGEKIGTWKRQRGTSLQQKLLKAAHPALVAEFTKEHFSRVLRISK